MQTTKSYRPNVAAVILSSRYPYKCEFFVAHRSDIRNAWQFPQGGIDEGETPREALKRELLEEIWANTNKGLAVGHDRFKDEIELLTGRRVKEKKRGRPLGWRKEKK